MKKISLQLRLTIITTLFIAGICGCLTMFVYTNGVYYMDSLPSRRKGIQDTIKIPKKSIYVFPMKSGRISLIISPFRSITTKQTIREKVLSFPLS